MNLPKATEILIEDINRPAARLKPELQEARRLSIEALKRIQKLRTYEYFGYDSSLAGETKE